METFVSTRRNTELLLLVFAAVPVTLLYAMYLVNMSVELSLSSLSVPLGLFGAFAVAHLAIRRLAPGADPAILPITFALSGIGISFVTKVAPPKYKGMMMGLWFCVTAIGNYLTSVIARIWGTGMPLWMVWGVLVTLCLLSAVFIFSIMKRLERATSGC